MNWLPRVYTTSQTQRDALQRLPTAISLWSLWIGKAIGWREIILARALALI